MSGQVALPSHTDTSTGRTGVIEIFGGIAQVVGAQVIGFIIVWELLKWLVFKVISALLSIFALFTVNINVQVDPIPSSCGVCSPEGDGDGGGDWDGNGDGDAVVRGWFCTENVTTSHVIHTTKCSYLKGKRYYEMKECALCNRKRQ